MHLPIGSLTVNARLILILGNYTMINSMHLPTTESHFNLLHSHKSDTYLVGYYYEDNK